MDNNIQWADLPPLVWPIIGKSLHSRVDVVRFRSVCTLWRSSRPPYQLPSRPPPPLPITFLSTAGQPKNTAPLIKSTTYFIESLMHGDLKFLVKCYEESESGRLRLMHPVTNSRISYSPDRVINLLDFGIVELRVSYCLKLEKNRVIDDVHRLVVLGDKKVFMICKCGKLGFVSFGDEKLTRVGDHKSDYDDIIVYKGQCYAVDKLGTIWWINSNLQSIQFSPPLYLYRFGGKKHLVESCGDLYVIDQYFESPKMDEDYQSDPDTIKFKVHKLDQESGWVDIEHLGRQVLIISRDGSFSVSTTKFPGVKGNCIFFIKKESKQNTEWYHSRVFNLENGRIMDLASFPCPQMVQLLSGWITPY